MKARTKITYENTNYVIKNAQKEVICKINYRIELPFHLDNFIYNLRNGDWYNFLDKQDLECVKDDVCYFTGRSYGYANCRDEDEWDLDFGRKLAQTRAQENIFCKATKVYDYLIERINEILKEANQYRFNINKSYENCVDHGDELISNKYVK